MNAPNALLETCRHLGIRLQAVGDRLKVDAPKGYLTPEVIAWLKAHKSELLDFVSHQPVSPLSKEDREAVQESIAERAAIHEMDGGLSRSKAEKAARQAMRVYRYRLTDNPQSWLTLRSPGSDLAEARRSLELKFGAERVLEVVEYRLNIDDID